MWATLAIVGAAGAAFAPEPPAATPAGGLDAPATESVNEDFDCYQPGAAASSLPGWELWPDAEDAFVTGELAFSGGASLHLDRVGVDVVRLVDFREIPVTVSVMTYVPSSSVDLEGYVLGLSSYDGGGPGTWWAMQVKFDVSLGLLEAQYSGETVPLIPDRWIELRAEIDLPADQYDLYYDGELWAQNLQWTGLHGGFLWLRGLDFYLPELASGPGMYIDDVVVVEAGFICPSTCGGPGSVECEGPCYADCDGSEILDFFDFLCFQNLFSAADPQADCDEDTELTFFDFLCFQNAFAAGCD